MSDTITAISRSLSADVEGLNTVSRNVANLATPGYQGVRDVPDFGQLVGVRQQVMLKDGPLKETGRALDLALRGRGFFVAQRGGQAVLVRGGNFVRAADGALLTREGDPVIGVGGAVRLPEGDLRVDAQGRIWSQGTEVAQLSVVDVAEPARLRSGPGGYRYDGALAAWTGQVQQGALEQSNVDAAEQTLHLIELTRHAESVQRVMSAYDRMLDTGINRIGDN